MVGVACVGIIAPHGGFCTHVEVEAAFYLIVMEPGSVHVVLTVVQVRRVRRLPLFAVEDEICSDTSVGCGECREVVIDVDGSRVVTGEPRREVWIRARLSSFQ